MAKNKLLLTVTLTFSLVSVLWFLVTPAYAATNVYYSVGQNTSDHSSGGNVSITSGVATFTVAQTKRNLGVGDRLTAGGNAYYLKSKISTTQWNVVTKLGAVPADLGSTAVTSIAHEYASLAAAQAGASDANHINNTSLVSADVILNIPCYYDTGADTTIVTINNWTTDSGHYFKIYTPYNTSTECNQSQRHNGKWDTGKYRLEVNTVWDWAALRSYVDWSQIYGLQIDASSSNNSGAAGIWSDMGNFIVGYCIIRAGGATYKERGIYCNYYHAAWMAYNNIIYGFTNGIATGGSNETLTTYLYNNTIYNCGTGINGGGNGLEVAKNNLIASCTTAASGTFAAGTDYNATNNASMGYTVTGGGNSHDRTSQTFTFVDATNRDLHITYTDTGARNYGADLSSDSYIQVTTDIDGQSRPTGSNVVDIGADEYQAQPIYRSVGVGSTSPLASGASNSMTITGSTATFTTGLANNIGVGDVIQYDSDDNGSVDALAFIQSRTDSTHYTVKDKYGKDPSVTNAADTDWAIYRAYTSLYNAEAGTENTGITSGLRDFDTWTGGKDLGTSTEQWNIACYADAADTAKAQIQGWTTTADNYLRIYTPTANSEVGVSQRHAGKWDTAKYRLEVTGDTALYLASANIKIIGLQCVSSNTYTVNGWREDTAASIWELSNNIFKDGTLSWGAVITGAGGFGAGSTIYFWNNVVYSVSTGQSGMWSGAANTTTYIYNNAFANLYTGISNSGSVVAKNNLFASCTTAASGTFAAGTDYNATNNASMGYTVTGGGNSHDRLSQTFTFVDEANKDFHLASNDAGAKDYGVSDPGSGLFSDDIDGQTRSGAWDIGADEYVAKKAVLKKCVIRKAVIR